MRLLARPLPGILILETEPRRDDRGFFARTFCREELKGLGLDPEVAQANVSFTEAEGTLRGLHYQLGPSAETKVVTCLAGAVHDVILDLRPTSPTFGRHVAVDLVGGSGKIAVVPKGCAHGFLTMASQSLVLYFVSTPYDPVRERGVRWDDPAFAIPWPRVPRLVSERDSSHPDFDPGFHLAA